MRRASFGTEEAEPHAFFEEDFVDFLYKPHTLFGLFVTLAYLGYLSLGRGVTTTEDNLRYSVLGCSVAFLLYCALQLRDGMLIRPHPVLWRVVNGAAILYLMILVFISMHDVAFVRTKLLPVLVDPSLGVLPESNTRIYAEDCRLFTPENPELGWANLKSAVVDVFMVAHALGWWAKAMLFRDYWLLWVLSFSWEAMEITFQHMLPNFKECWWDHYLLDVFGCNLLGMWLGMAVCRHLKKREYNWTGVTRISSTKGKISRVLGQLTPFSWMQYEWAALSSWKRLMQVTLMLAFVELCELNAFFLKHALWVPPPCWINVARLVTLGMLSFPALREYYSYIHNPACKRMGSSLWLMVAIGAVETLIVFKFYLQDPGMFHYPAGMKAPVPDTPLVINAWICSISMFLVWMVLHFGLKKYRTSQKWFSHMLEALLVSSSLPLVYLGVVDFWDTWTH